MDRAKGLEGLPVIGEAPKVYGRILTEMKPVRAVFIPGEHITDEQFPNLPRHQIAYGIATYFESTTPSGPVTIQVQVVADAPYWPEIKHYRPTCEEAEAWKYRLFPSRG